jgi:hypothetical protein
VIGLAAGMEPGRFTTEALGAPEPTGLEARASSPVLVWSPQPAILKRTLHQTSPHRIPQHVLYSAAEVIHFPHGSIERLFLPHSTLRPRYLLIRCAEELLITCMISGIVTVPFSSAYGLSIRCT